MSKEMRPHYFRLRDLKTSREFFAEWSDIAGEWYEKDSGTAHSAGDVEIVSKSQGGVRPGAGRKALAPDQKKVSVTISVSARTAKMLRELRDAGDNINGLVSHIIAVRYEQIITGHLQIEK